MPQETLDFLKEQELSGFDFLGLIEKSIGNMSEPNVVKELGGLLGNPSATKYVNDIGQKLVAHSDRKDFGYRFDILRNNTPNAFALPNGSIYVTSGLLRMLRTESQLANVLGHELSHVTGHHTVDQIKANLAARGALSIFNRLFSSILSKAVSEEDRKNATSMAFELVTKGYSRSLESEADKNGQTLAAKSGWDPIGMVDVMSIFATLEKDSPKGVEAYLRSHPNPKDRMKQAHARLADLPKGGKIGTENYGLFLEKILGISKDEAVLSPTEAALRFIDREEGPKKESVSPGIESYLVPGIIIGVGFLLILILLLLHKK